ncbi:unnamed protein product, partial [Scytosiphon promiscuus]
NTSHPPVPVEEPAGLVSTTAPPLATRVVFSSSVHPDNAAPAASPPLPFSQSDRRTRVAAPASAPTLTSFSSLAAHPVLTTQPPSRSDGGLPSLPLSQDVGPEQPAAPRFSSSSASGTAPQYEEILRGGSPLARIDRSGTTASVHLARRRANDNLRRQRSVAAPMNDANVLISSSPCYSPSQPVDDSLPSFTSPSSVDTPLRTYSSSSSVDKSSRSYTSSLAVDSSSSSSPVDDSSSRSPSSFPVDSSS